MNEYQKKWTNEHRKHLSIYKMKWRKKEDKHTHYNEYMREYMRRWRKNNPEYKKGYEIRSTMKATGLNKEQVLAYTACMLAIAFSKHGFDIVPVGAFNTFEGGLVIGVKDNQYCLYYNYKASYGWTTAVEEYFPSK